MEKRSKHWAIIITSFVQSNNLKFVRARQVTQDSALVENIQILISKNSHDFSAFFQHLLTFCEQTSCNIVKFKFFYWYRQYVHVMLFIKIFLWKFRTRNNPQTSFKFIANSCAPVWSHKHKYIRDKERRGDLTNMCRSVIRKFFSTPSIIRFRKIDPTGFFSLKY